MVSQELGGTHLSVSGMHLSVRMENKFTLVASLITHQL